MWYWHQHRHVDQWKIEDPSMSSHNRSYLILEKEAKTKRQPQENNKTLQNKTKNQPTKNNIQNNDNKNILKKR